MNLPNTGVNTKKRGDKNQDIKILQDFNIRTNCVKEARRPDIVLTKKNNQETFIIDMAITMNFRVRDQKAEKISKP